MRFKKKGGRESLRKKALPRDLFPSQIRLQVPNSSPLTLDSVLRMLHLLLRVTVSLCVDPKLTCSVNHVETDPEVHASIK